MTRRLASILMLAVALCLALPLAARAEKNKFEQEVDVEQAAVAFVRAKQEPSDQAVRKAAMDLADQVGKGGYGILTVKELKERMDRDKDLVIIDTMPLEAYKAEHIPGAGQFLFPVAPMETWNPAETGGKSEADFDAALGGDKEKTIVVYCGFVTCTRSHNAALWAKKLGYAKVIRVPGGIFAWKGAGYPVESAK